MARALHKLTDTAIRAKNIKAGRHNDGGGLYLNVSKAGNKSWVFLYKRDGARWPKEMGLGAYPDVSLSLARDLAAECRRQLAAGLDPLEEKKKVAEPTFAEAAAALISSMGASWRNAKHKAQWEMTLGDSYCKAIRPKKVSAINTDDVLSVLNPIWQSKPETASRLRGRIERVLDFAKARGWRTGENPALWRGHLKNILPAPKKLSRGHHAAMPYKKVPEFVSRLRAHPSLSARALELLILTAARTGEVVKMEWPEVDFDAAVWTVPAERMKANRVHRVPLSTRALDILKELHAARTGRFVFPGEQRRKTDSKTEKSLSNMSLAMLLRRLETDVTAHGFRSSFRDWAGDCTSFPRELAEASLAHRVGDATELAYRRSDAIERRRALMTAWCDYCLSHSSQAPAANPQEAAR